MANREPIDEIWIDFFLLLALEFWGLGNHYRLFMWEWRSGLADGGRTIQTGLGFMVMII